MSKVLLCATDAGGVKNLVAVSESLLRNGDDFLFITTSDYTTYFDAAYKHRLKIVDSGPDEIFAERFLREVSPKKLICGTTRYLSQDRVFTKAAKKMNIKTVAVLDEWYNYRIRFTDERKELAYLPDCLAVMDHVAVREAVEEGIPEEILSITGSPALTQLYNRFSAALSNAPQYPAIISPYKNHLKVLFISEEQKADYGSEPTKLGKYLGYDEEIVLHDLLDIITDTGKETVLIEKLHPSSKRQEGLKELRHGTVLLTIKNHDLLPLVWYCDIVVGMKSIALLESAMLNKATCSYQPNLLFPNQCTAVKLNLIPLINEKIGLRNWIENNLTLDKNKPQLRKFDCIDNEASEKIIGL